MKRNQKGAARPAAPRSRVGVHTTKQAKGADAGASQSRALAGAAKSGIAHAGNK